MSDLEQLAAEARAAIADADDGPALEALRVDYLGKKGRLTALLKGLGALSPEERPAAGAQINEVKQALQALIGERRAALEAAAVEARLAAEAVDVTLPGRDAGLGHLHPITRTIERMEDFFGSVGFEVADGPEIEDDYYNFEALNFPPHHPARAEHDTFFVDDRTVLRTHTSPVQVRVMESRQPPLRIICPGASTAATRT
jgi:phenylalanyl-tRNA synthetase alpha chain